VAGSDASSLPQSAVEAHGVIHPATRIGNIHFNVASLEAQIQFYHKFIGFQLHWQEWRRAGLGAGGEAMVRDFRMGMVSTGGYHHHIGFNTWVGEGAAPPPANALGLRYFTVILSDQVELESTLQAD
jgi:catechol 2,3-dioxygenase